MPNPRTNGPAQRKGFSAKRGGGKGRRGMSNGPTKAPSAAAVNSSHTLRHRKKTASRFDVYDYGSAPEGREQKRLRRGTHPGENDEGLEESEDHHDKIVDDEEIDEEEAFDSDDEKKWGEHFGNDGRSGGVDAEKQHSDASDDEDQNSSDDDDETEKGEFLSDMLGVSGLPSPQDGEGSDGSDTDSSGDTSEEDPMDEDDDKLANLEAMVTSLGPKRRDKGHAGGNLMAEAFEENEFNVPSRSHGEKKVRLEDLIGALDDTSGFLNLKRSVQNLRRNTGSKSETESGALSTPLPHRLQERAERKAAYEESKKEISKWTPAVKKYRESENLDMGADSGGKMGVTSAALAGNLKPQNDLEKEIRKFLADASLLSERKRAEFEELEGADISMEELKSRRVELAKMRSLMFYHELKLKKAAKIKSRAYRKLKKEEAAKRSASDEAKSVADLDPERVQEERLRLEVARAKERITLRHRGKGQWAKEIARMGKNGHEETRKSTSALLNERERLRNKIMSGTSRESDSDEDMDDSNGVEEDGDDARENAVLALKKLESELNEDPEQPQTGIMSMKFMQLGERAKREEARKAIETMRKELENTGSESDEYSHNASASVTRATNVGRRTFGKDGQNPPLDLIAASASNATEVTQGATFSMTTGTAIEFGRGKIFTEEAFELDDASTITHQFKPGSEVDISSSGSKTSSEVEIPGHSKAAHKSSSFVIDSEVLRKRTTTAPRTAVQRPLYQPEAENPWLSDLNDHVGAVKSTEERSGRDGRRSERALTKVGKDKREALAKNNGRNNIAIASDLDVDALRPLERPAVQAKSVDASKGTTKDPTNPSTQSPQPQLVPPTSAGIQKRLTRDDDDSDGDSDVGPQYAPNDSHFNLIHKTDLRALSNPELMRLAFNNDDALTEEFEEERKREMGGDEPHSENGDELPGWGSWGGAGVKESRKRKRDTNGGAGRNSASSAASLTTREKRKDAKLPNVIINEKNLRKSAKYMISSVPYPFETREQYEASLRVPVGQEWNAQNTFQKRIKPRIISKPGKPIQPPKLPKK